MAWLVLGEVLAPPAIAGLAVASLGCWLVNRSPST
jgi:drug/metabolite transporter (DMT)-like permease